MDRLNWNGLKSHKHFIWWSTTTWSSLTYINWVEWLFETRRLFRFTARITNHGKADFRPIIPKQSWLWHACHRHFHSMEVFAHFDILDPRSKARVAEGHKASFCLEDNHCLPGTSSPKYKCANFGDQGISVGCTDTYLAGIDCQWIDITDLPPGLYLLKVGLPSYHLSLSPSISQSPQ